MPNHVEQDLSITGPRDELAKLERAVCEYEDDDLNEKPEGPDTPGAVVEDVQRAIGGRPVKSVFSANKVIPYPARFADADRAAETARTADLAAWSTVKDGYNNGGYEWCMKNWGTKWGTYDAELERTKRGLTYHFQSAWSPAKPVIAELARRFPRLRFKLRYFDGGAGFQGKAEWAAGKLASESEAAYRGSRGG